MARKCYVTGLGSTAGNNRSHSLQATRRTWKANLQKVNYYSSSNIGIIPMFFFYIK